MRRANSLDSHLGELALLEEGIRKANFIPPVLGPGAPCDGVRIDRIAYAISPPGRTQEKREGGDLGMKVGRRGAKQAKSEDLWDIFLSYRVNTDQKLVQDLYWRLVGTDVVVNGKSRKIRPFWDVECLRSGENWEVGFCNAICRSTVIVVVMSRNALASVEHLEPHSACDNVILEYALAHALVRDSLRIEGKGWGLTEPA